MLFGATPCFSGQPPLVATELYEQLRPYAINVWSHSADDTPSGTLGSCTIEQGVLRTAAGLDVAEAHCGLAITARGVVDPFGLQIGATGQQVLDAYRAAAADIACYPDGEGRSRCWFDETEDSWQAFGYVVAGTPPTSDDWGVRREDAASFFATRTVIELQQRGNCH